MLLEVLDRARAVGFLGPGPVASHIDHAERFGTAIDVALGLSSGGSGGLVDIGAGGGVPSLPLLWTRPDLRGTLIDASQKRCSFLVWAAAELGMADRVQVWCGRAEEIGRQDRGREQFAVLVARGFGPPPATLECGAPLVVEGGRLVISEPPERRAWPAEVLADELGLVEVESPDGVVVLERRGPLPHQIPRTAKQQKRSPLFTVG